LTPGKKKSFSAVLAPEDSIAVRFFIAHFGELCLKNDTLVD